MASEDDLKGVPGACVASVGEERDEGTDQQEMTRRRSRREAGARNAGRRHRRGGVTAAACLAGAALSGKVSCFTVRGPRGVHPQTRSRTRPLLWTSPHPSEGDFSDFYGGDGQDDGAAELASEFYREVRTRGGVGEGEPASSDEGEGAGLTRRGPRDADPGRRPDPSPPFVLPDLPEIDLLSLLSDLFPPPSPAASTSAGLFSGQGSTVMSPDQASLLVDVEMLERAASGKRDGTGDGAWWAASSLPWDTGDSSADADERRARLLRLAIASLILLSAMCAAHEASPPPSSPSDGVLIIERAAELLQGAIVHESDRLEGVMTSLVVSGGQGETLLAREAAWLARETAHLGSSMAAAVRQVEELVVP